MHYVESQDMRLNLIILWLQMNVIWEWIEYRHQLEI